MSNKLRIFSIHIYEETGYTLPDPDHWNDFFENYDDIYKKKVLKENDFEKVVLTYDYKISDFKESIYGKYIYYYF